MAITVNCVCGKVMSVPDSLAGKKGKCPGCQAVLTIPAIGAAPAPAPSTKAVPVAPAKPATGRIPAAPKAQTVPAAAPAAAKPPAAPAEPLPETFAKGKTCPTCKKAVSDQTIFCVACGTNLLTGKKMKTLTE